jgi:DNA-directed RNA polymerase subunit N (RpoN/RPB10)
MVDFVRCFICNNTLRRDFDNYQEDVSCLYCQRDTLEIPQHHFKIYLTNQ